MPLNISGKMQKVFSGAKCFGWGKVKIKPGMA
jgi:hypothetical protein